MRYARLKMLVTIVDRGKENASVSHQPGTKGDTFCAVVITADRKYSNLPHR